VEGSRLMAEHMVLPARDVRCNPSLPPEFTFQAGRAKGKASAAKGVLAVVDANVVEAAQVAQVFHRLPLALAEGLITVV